MANTRKFDIVIGKVYNNGVLCPNPIVEYIGQTGVALPCKNEAKGIYTVEVLEGQVAGSCLTFIIRCADCHDCPPILKEVCLCDSTTDCGPCEYCDCNVCVSKCEPGQQCCEVEPNQYVCCDCKDSTECPCNQVCVSGKCVCPPGTTLNPITGCCDACKDDTDCPPCFICEQGTCIPKPCVGVCDPTGVCGIPEACVECLSSSDCNGANECCEGCSCVCCPGYVRVNGICVPRPQCTSDADCTIIDPCLRCEQGVCRRQRCPSGEIAVVVNGACQCLPKCDCDAGDCNKVTDYCDAVTATDCACFPCQGNCTTGCLDPCYCSPILQKCVDNPCKDIPCNSGIDCPETCGCFQGVCTPCELLSCANTDCDKALGCECLNNRCVPDRCVGDCATAFDCAQGCTCFQGKCVSCDNFSCTPVTNCTSNIGCVCVGGNCQGGDKTCNDSLNIIKDDDNCSITGELTMQNCCSCSPLTLDIKGKRSGEDATTYSLTFLAEVRKGSYDGVNPDSNPRLDDFSNDNIADNEPPISGVITMTSQIVYNIYRLNTVTGNYEFAGSSTTNGDTKTASFPSSGTVAGIEFPAVQFPKIGVRAQVDETTQREASEVRIRFYQSSTMNFDNKCSYIGGIQIGEYDILSQNNWLQFTTGPSFNNPIATTITSSVCRDPFFVWFRDGSIVRKSYIPGGPIYRDVITRPPYEWLESCHEYALKVDCSCDTDTNRYIVFCNPQELDFTIDPLSCNSCITIDEFNTCTPNEDLEFYVEFGDVRIAWIGDNAPIGQKRCSTVPFTGIEFGLTCDTEGICTKNYPVDGDGILDITPVTNCEASSSQFTVYFPTLDDSGTCLVDYVEINGLVLSNPICANPSGQSSFCAVLPIGSYTARVYWKCGCPFTEITVHEDCCSFNVGSFSRLCGGETICQPLDGVTYSLVNSQGTVSVLTDVCATLNSLGAQETIVIRAQRGECQPVNIPIGSPASECCNDFSVQINQITPNISDIIVVSGTVYVVTVTNTTTGGVVSTDNPSSGGMVLSANGMGRFTLSGYSEGDNITVAVVDEACGGKDANFVAGDCVLSVTITEFVQDGACRLKASTPLTACQCNSGLYHVDIIPGGITSNDTTITIPFSTALMGFEDIPVTGGELYAGRSDIGDLSLVALTGGPNQVEGNGSITVQRNLAITPECKTLNVEMELSGVDPNGNSTLEVFVKDGNTGLLFIPDVLSWEVIYNNTIGLEAGSGLKVFTNCCIAGFPLQVTVNVTYTDGSTFTGVTPLITLQVGESKTAATNVCKALQLTSENVPVRFELRSLALEDNCTYSTIDVNFLISPSGTVLPAAIQSGALVPINPNAKYVKFTWLLDGGEVWDEFKGLPDNFTSVLPLGYSIVGANYEVIAECLPCIDYDQKQLCCLPTLIGYEIFGCNASADLTFQGNPGDYTVVYDGEPYPFTIAPSGVGAVSITGNGGGPLTLTTGLIKVGFICEDTWDIVLVVPCTPVIETECDPLSPGMYQITVSGCGSAPDASLAITNLAPGSVAGMTITGCDPMDPPEVELTDSNGCVQDLGLIGTGPGLSCSAPSSSEAPPSSSNPPSSSEAPASSGASSSNPASSSNLPAPSSLLPPASSGLPPTCSASVTTPGTVQAACINAGPGIGFTGKVNVFTHSIGYQECCGVTATSANWRLTGPGGSGIVQQGTAIGTVGATSAVYAMPPQIVINCQQFPSGTYEWRVSYSVTANNCTFSFPDKVLNVFINQEGCGCVPPSSSNLPAPSSQLPPASSSKIPASSSKLPAPSSTVPGGSSSKIPASSSKIPAPSSSKLPASSSQPPACVANFAPNLLSRANCNAYSTGYTIEYFIYWNACCGVASLARITGIRYYANDVLINNDTSIYNRPSILAGSVYYVRVETSMAASCNSYPTPFARVEVDWEIVTSCGSFIQTVTLGNEDLSYLGCCSGEL